MGRRHLVTGATSGMGNAIVRLLRDKGEEVVIVVRDSASAKSVGSDDYLVCDLSRPESIELAFSSLKGEFDSFINCAGISQPKSFKEQTASGLQEIMNVNLISPMLITKEISGRMKEGGVIVLFGSQSSFKGSYDDGYAASKGGIHSFVMSVSGKLAPRVRIINLAPGIVVPTRMTTSQMSEELLNKKKEQIPLKQFGDPKDIAEIVYFLTTKACRFVTGATIDVNGGLTLR